MREASEIMMISRTCLCQVVLISSFDVDYASGAYFWSNYVKGHNTLSALKDVEPP